MACRWRLRWWLHQSLSELAGAFGRHRSRLILRRGESLKVLSELLESTGADAVYWNRRYEPAAIARDREVKQSLRASGIVCSSFNGALLMEPWDLSSAAGRQYRVFTPFKKRLLELLEIPRPIPAPRNVPGPSRWPQSLSLDALQLLPQIRWYAEMSRHWLPGERAGLARARGFVKRAICNYSNTRDIPSAAGTSGLSPHLHFGEVSVRRLLHWIPPDTWRESRFVSELVWREFAQHMLYHYPHTSNEPLDRQFEQFPWQPQQAKLQAWQRGLTGFPLVDAGMRQLWALGWMHNRVRMIVGSLLVKNLRQPWLAGARWFWDTLVDADLAANTLNWQWVAGCGADAAPYFRVFNPVLQAMKFDPHGDYVRRWVPELTALSADYIHAPHLAPRAVLDAAGVRIGETYPAPIIDLKESRDQALAAYRAMKAV